MPAKTQDELFACLDSLGIKHSTQRHEPVFTVSESQSLRDQIPGGHTKNLFLKDKKGAYFLVTLEENAVVDLKSFKKMLHPLLDDFFRQDIRSVKGLELLIWGSRQGGIFIVRGVASWGVVRIIYRVAGNGRIKTEVPNAGNNFVSANGGASDE